MRIARSLFILWGVVISIGCRANPVRSSIQFDTTASPVAESLPNTPPQSASTKVEVSTQTPSITRIVPTIWDQEIIATPMSGDLSRLIDIAKVDLAQRVGTVPEEIELLHIEKAEWPDTSPGCAKHGLSRRPVVISGYRILLRAMEQEFEYHTNRESGIVFCPKR